MRDRRKCITPLLESLEPRVLLSAVFPTYQRLAAASPFGTIGPQGYSPAQIRHAYGVDQLPYTGAGQTIAIIDAYSDPTIRSDLHHFDAAFGLPDPTFNIVAQGGITVDPSGAGNSNFEGEEALDVEWAHAMAPGATITLVEAANASLNNIFAAVDYARKQPGVSVVSMSLGIYEFLGQSELNSVFTTPAGHIPVTFVASTGDAAAPGSFPAYSSNVVAAGGTSLTVDTAGNYVSERGWSDSGGGISELEAKPSYQDFLPINNRATPDVAFDADPNTGVPIYDSYNNGTVVPWEVIGGTSVAAPAWAGLIALANQGRNAAGKPTLNSRTDTLPLLYSAPAEDFHDITAGNNGYSAGPGYDLVTGLGSPVANLLIPWLINGTPSATPHGNFAPFGFLDTVGPTTVAGWTIDPDNSSASLTVQLYVDGAIFGTQTANLTRNDLTATYGSADHGFSFDISSLAPGKHKIQLFAVDTNTGSATRIGGTRSINTNQRPTGWVDVFDHALKGWAFDPNAGSDPIRIAFSIDSSPLRVALANVQRPDLQSHVGSTDHGFSLELPELSFGMHTVKVYALDSTTGDRTFIGEKTTFIPLIRTNRVLV
jgi:subtilase family serine protease